MASKYTNISIDEMRGFLKPDKGWKENGQQHKEFVFDYNLAKYPFILIRVYSGIVQSGESRGCGRDAIRICAVNLKTNRGWIKASRVYRVMGWQKNLKERVLEVIEQAKKRMENPNPLATNNLSAEREIQQIEGAQL
jgi:hypothetical protein